MRDYLGRELKVGQKVVACVGTGRSRDLRKATVTGFTRMFVLISGTCQDRIVPTYCVVYEEPEAV